MRHAPRLTRPCGNTIGRRRRAGFTLVELLVVIGIIAVLLAIILPSMKKARMSAQKVQCMSNMRQITLACLMFSNDHHGCMVNRSASSLLGWDQYGNLSGSTAGKNPLTNSVTDTSSWVSWQRAIDPVTGLPGGDDENIT
jgi:prepilin-type N-terminal cleavage/methylation domain-containing protein